MISPTRHFLLYTTGHGFYRICEGSKLVRAIWLLILIGCIIGCVIQSSFLINKFFAYKVNINIELKSDPDLFVYPDVTICPTTQLSLQLNEPHFSNYLPEISFENASRNAQNVWQIITNDHMKDIRDFNPTVRGTMKPYLDFSNVSHHQYSFMAKCFFGPYECSAETITLFNDYDYVCQTIRVEQKNDSSSFYDLLEMRLVDGYFEEVIAQIYKFLSNNEHTQFVPGTLVSIDLKGTIPNLMRNKIIITKNNEATIMISLSKYEYQTEKSDCIKNDNAVKLEIIQNDKITQYNYSDDACINIETQRVIYETCDCISRKYLIPAQLLMKSRDITTYCQYLPKEMILNNEQIKNFPVHIYKNRYYCEKSLVQNINKNEKYFLKKCPIMCVKMQFETNIKESKWPDLVNKSQYPYFRVYLEDLLNISSSRYLPTDYLKFKLNHLTDTSDFESTFSRLRLRILDLRPSVLQETLSYQPINLWSEIGGLLGLYLGFSVITLCEVIEWLLSSIYVLIKGRHH